MAKDEKLRIYWGSFLKMPSGIPKKYQPKKAKPQTRKQKTIGRYTFGGLATGLGLGSLIGGIPIGLVAGVPLGTYAGNILGKYKTRKKR
jgi:hypothetical protein